MLPQHSSGSSRSRFPSKGRGRRGVLNLVVCVLFGAFMLGLVWELSVIFDRSVPGGENGGGRGEQALALEALEKRLEERLLAEIRTKQQQQQQQQQQDLQQQDLRQQPSTAALASSVGPASLSDTDETRSLQTQLESAQASLLGAERKISLQQEQAEAALKAAIAAAVGGGGGADSAAAAKVKKSVLNEVEILDGAGKGFETMRVLRVERISLPVEVEELKLKLSSAQTEASVAGQEAQHVKAEADHWREQVAIMEGQLKDSEEVRFRLKASLGEETKRAEEAASSAMEAAAAAQSAMAHVKAAADNSAAAAAASGAEADMGFNGLGRGGEGGGGGQKWYEKPGYGRLISPYEYHLPLPPLIEAWRHVHIDWHDLIPQHSSLWERYGESKDDKFNFMKLVMKEVAVTDYLTQYKDSGLASNFGHDFGPMRNYSACNLVDDPCQIHGEHDCGLNSFCAWDKPTFSCASFDGNDRTDNDRNGPARSKGCTAGGSPRKLVGARLQAVNDPSRECKVFVNERLFVEHVSEDPATMFYHWWRYFKEVHSRVREAGAMDKINHILVSKPPNTQFFHYFGLLSKFCWRRTTSVPEGTCFCHGSEIDGKGGGDRGHNNVIEHLTSELHLNGPDGRPPAPKRVRIGILSRRRKRFILNEHELVEALLKRGWDVQLLPMEEMTLYEQIKALRETTVLVGIHGSGLNNALLLPAEAVLVQLLPYKLNYKGAFSQVARENGVHYLEWALEDPKRAWFHWEFLNKQQLGSGKEAVLSRGSPRGGAEVYTFWINQDVIIPVGEFMALIATAVEKTGKLNPELARKQGLLE